VEQPRTGIGNRRAAIRRKPKSIQVRCRRGWMGVGPDIALTLRSISETGALLLVTDALKPAEEVELEFDASFFPKPLRVRANVVRAKIVPGNVYCVGVKFQQRISYADFNRLT